MPLVKSTACPSSPEGRHESFRQEFVPAAKLLAYVRQAHKRCAWCNATVHLDGQPKGIGLHTRTLLIEETP